MSTREPRPTPSHPTDVLPQARLDLQVLSGSPRHGSLGNAENAVAEFLCEYFTAAELVPLARGILRDENSLISSLPPISSVSLQHWANEFCFLLKRHGFFDDDFFSALCAARPRLKHVIHELWNTAIPVASAPRQSSEKTPDSRLRIRLEIDMEDLSSEALEALLKLFRLHSGDSRMTIESVTKGSTILVLRGDKAALERLKAHLKQRDRQIADIRVSAVDAVPQEYPSRSSEPPQLQRSRVSVAEVTSSRLIIESLNLNRAERLLCIEALRVSSAISAAARLLGISSASLKRLMTRHRIDSEVLDRDDEASGGPYARIVFEDLNLNAAERQICEEALHIAGSIVDAASLLGLTRQALKRRMKEHAIEWPRRSEREADAARHLTKDAS